MRIFALCAAFSCSSLFAAGERASLNIFTEPDSAYVFLDNNPEKEISGTPFENSAMLTGEHRVFLVLPNESFVPASYEFMLQSGKTFEIRHDFLRRNQAFEAYTLSPSEFHLEFNAGFLYSSDSSRMPLDFRLGLPWGFGAKLAFPVQEKEVKRWLLGAQYNYFPLQIGMAMDWISPRGSGYSAIRAALLAEQNIWIFNLLENAVYEYSKEDKTLFYLRAGVPIKHIFMPCIALRKDHLISIEPGALLQAGNWFSLEVSVPIANGIGVYFGIHSDFSFHKKVKKTPKSGSVIWDVNAISNREYKAFCKDKGCKIPDDDYPVASVSLKDAMAYAKHVNKRLPTADEWKSIAATYSNFDNACENPTLKKASDGPIINGIRNFAGNAAIWLAPENESASIASFAGSSYGDSPEACKRKSVLTDISSPRGSEFIGIRLVRDL